MEQKQSLSWDWIEIRKAEEDRWKETLHCPGAMGGGRERMKEKDI